AGAGYEALVAHEYDFAYEPQKKLFFRLGTKREDFDTPVVVPVDVVPDGGTLLFELDGERMRLTRMGDVMARLDLDETDPDAPGGASDIYRVFNLSLFSSQVRVPSFGSVGMTTYAKEPGTFNALIAGEFGVDLESYVNPTAKIDYRDYHELDGILVNGLQITRANTDGDGPMDGVLDVECHLAPRDVGTGATPYLTGTVDFSGLVVTNGVAADGFYLLSYAGQAHEIPYTIAADEDLTGILPIAE